MSNMSAQLCLLRLIAASMDLYAAPMVSTVQYSGHRQVRLRRGY